MNKPSEFDFARVGAFIQDAKTSGGTHLTPNDAEALARVLLWMARRDASGVFEMLDKLIGLGNANGGAWTAVRDHLRAEVAS